MTSIRRQPGEPGPLADLVADLLQIATLGLARPDEDRAAEPDRSRGDRTAGPCPGRPRQTQDRERE